MITTLCKKINSQLYTEDKIETSGQNVNSHLSLDGESQ